MAPMTKNVLTTVAAGVIMALVYGASDVVFTTYANATGVEQNKKDIAETKDNTKEAANKATEAANGVARIEGQQQAILDALKDIQRRLP